MARKSISTIIIKQLLYNQLYKCNTCKCMLPPTYQIDHITPWSETMNNSIENLQALCPNCHAVKTVSDTLRLNEIKKKEQKEQKEQSERKVSKYFLKKEEINNITVILTCDCNPGFAWKSERSYNSHYRTKKHLKWEIYTDQMEICDF